MLFKLSPMINTVIKNCHGHPGASFDKSPGHGHTITWYKFWQHFPIILYHFKKDPFCLIILYDILFYFIHEYIAAGQEETTLGDNYF